MFVQSLTQTKTKIVNITHWVFISSASFRYQTI